MKTAVIEAESRLCKALAEQRKCADFAHEVLDAIINGKAQRAKWQLNGWKRLKAQREETLQLKRELIQILRASQSDL